MTTIIKQYGMIIFISVVFLMMFAIIPSVNVSLSESARLATENMARVLK